jgi:signal transduction histidine kinase
MKTTYRERSLRFPLAIIFILTILIVALNSMVENGRIFTFQGFDWALFGGGYLGLMFIELVEGWLYPRRPNYLLRMVLIGSRVVCIAAIYQVDTTRSSLPIFSVALYAIYFYAGFLPLLLIVVGCFGLLATQTAFQNFNLIEQLAYMTVMILIAIEIKRDDRIRQRNLELMREVENYAANSTIQAKQDERYRISRDLHDRLGHQLVAINIQLQKAVAYREIDAAESDQAILAAQQANTEAIRELRETLGSLREIDTPTDFRTDLDKLIDGVQKNGLAVTLSIRGSEEGFSNLVLLTLRQVVQEGLTNVEKHARASHVDLSLIFERRRVTLTLQDDGVGFSPDHLEKEGRYGLSGLRERVELTRGKFKIDSKPGRGTTLKITIPRKLVQ